MDYGRAFLFVGLILRSSCWRRCLVEYGRFLVANVMPNT